MPIFIEIDTLKKKESRFHEKINSLEIERKTNTEKIQQLTQELSDCKN